MARNQSYYPKTSFQRLKAMDIYLNSILGFLLICVHHWARRMFYRLPLHNETGFYVSNDTILNRRVNPRKSWHARFSGGNKIIAELFFSFVYLSSGGRKYAYFSRLFYTVLSILLFPAMAIICSELGMGRVEVWTSMFFLALVLAEPQFGGYYESAEQFELFPLLWGMACLLMGFNSGSELLVGVGLGLWVLCAFFVKFSFIVTPFVFSVQLFKQGDSWLVIAAPWICGIGLYLSWLAILECHPFRSFAGTLRQKMLGGHRLFSKQGLLLLYTKFQQTLDVFGQNLPVLLIGAYGFFYASSEIADSNHHYLFVLTMCLLISFFIQGQPASHHTLPLVPVLVIWASYGASILRAFPLNFWTAFSWLALFGYYVVFFLRPKFVDPEDFYRWTWSTRPKNIPESEIQKDLVLLNDVARIKSKTFDFSVFLAGPHTQLQVLLETAYPTTLVCAGPWLDDLEPDWQREVVELFRVYPAPYILDTAECFSMTNAIRWGLTYELLDENPGFWRLYGHKPSQTTWKGQEGKPAIFDFSRYQAQQA